MTTKQIAEATGKTDRSVRNWVTKAAEKSSVIAEKSSASSPMKPADYDLDETCAIIAKGLGANAASVYRMNAEQSTMQVTDNDSMAIIAESLRVMSANTAAIMAMLDETRSRVDKVEYKQHQRAALLPAPQKDARAELTQLVNSYAHQQKDGDFRAAWGDLYKEVYYRMRTNVRVRARNEGVNPVDIMEQEDMLDSACAIMGELLGGEV